MRFKRTITIFTACLLVIPTFFVSATSNQNSYEQEEPKGKGSYSEKHEVVYATLDANGQQQDMYIVNNFNIEKPGQMIDYGSYSSVKNLTNLNEIEQEDEKVKFTAEEEQFYYQGNLEEKPLPWDINVKYLLDGQTIQPDELLGKDGQLEIQIDTSANPNADSTFFENYLLQISLTLDSKIYQNIETEKGTIANAGKNKQVTFTVMPEKKGSFVLKADANDFELEGIQINALPSSMTFDSPETGDMTKDIESLSNATSEVNKGVSELTRGISELNDGASSLASGSRDYKSGINQLDQSSSELIKGSESIKQALEEMNQSMNSESSGMDMNQFKELQQGLDEIAKGLKETENGLTEFKDSYNQAYQAIDQSINAIPGHDISEKDIQKLYESNADSNVIGQLVETYQAAQNTKATYTNVKEAFEAVDPTLSSVIDSLSEMRTNLEKMSNNLGKSLDQTNMDELMNQLKEGLTELSSNYESFHAGLLDYTDGVSELSTSYGELHGGISGLNNGAEDLENGARELNQGTDELADSTSDLPNQMTSEINQMVSEYDKSDFEPTSFVSDKNEKVKSVQFVIKTESIKKDEDQEEEQPEYNKEKKGFWDRLLDLFR
ncbi:YhgE/Pip domain-containing protein [Filobacillus milosensis]|uniref:YhgE/Pip domain-containing protein n=1 Tax=Filobacillus milosensis TaxID=94137 RepID=A0A4Y8IEH7_9BACI|nr:YhgE/Pip domain-containing protein [Filobacillus milosensis]TFB13471.1 YhgE/Pip domain-containing protein [Filobacillus milosensis]